MEKVSGVWEKLIRLCCLHQIERTVYLSNRNKERTIYTFFVFIHDADIKR